MHRSILTALLLVPLPALPGYRAAVPGYHFEFPHDHFAHPDFRTEWWYYTGNLQAKDGHRYGFELVFFRQGADAEARLAAAKNPSAWTVQDYFIAHLALSDIDGRRFRYFERVNRKGPGLAGADFERGRIWNGNWQALWDLPAGTQTLSAVADGIRFTLRLKPGKPPVVHGENGISRKSWEEGRASYYVSFTRLEVEGTLNGGAVAGTAWMDHEWFTNLLAPNERGWDWFSAQLADGTELMLFQVRRDDGKQPYSAGTLVGRDGRATYLKPGDFSLRALEYWRSPKSGARYPVRWRIAIPRLKVDLECAAAMNDQELVESQEGNTYWEGAVTYSGSARGAGYLELTGYAHPVKM